MNKYYIGIDQNGWYIRNKIDGNKIYENTDRINNLINNINKSKIERAFLYHNLKDLGIVINGHTIVLQNYDSFKNQETFSDLNKKINRALWKTAMKNISLGKFHLDKSKVIGGAIALTIGAVGLKFALSSDKQIDKTINNGVSISTDEDSVSNKKMTDSLLDDSSLADDYYDGLINKNVKIGLKEQLEELFNQYKDTFGVDDNTIENLITTNYREFSTSSNLERDVINVLYDYYAENLYLVNPIQVNNNSEEKIEKVILKYAHINEINDPDVLATMLAVFQLETGHATSEYCHLYNNLGGVYGTNVYTNEFEIKKYPNLDVAAVDFVNVFLRIKNKCEADPSYDHSMSLAYNMNPTYCTENVNNNGLEWYQIVDELKTSVYNSNILDEFTNTKKEGKAIY